MYRYIRKSLSLFKVFNTIAFILMCYQIIDLMTKYLKYETNIELIVKKNFQEIPALTFCVDSFNKSFVNKKLTNQQLNQRMANLLVLVH